MILKETPLVHNCNGRVTAENSTCFLSVFLFSAEGARALRSAGRGRSQRELNLAPPSLGQRSTDPKSFDFKALQALRNRHARIICNRNLTQNDQTELTMALQ